MESKIKECEFCLKMQPVYAINALHIFVIHVLFLVIKMKKEKVIKRKK